MVFFASPKARIWLAAIRPLSLPLGVSAVVLGYGLASMYGIARPAVFALALLTTMLLQILSNIANDYGDGMSGADNEHRKGPQRMVSTGLISPKEMLQVVIVLALLSAVSGLTLLLVACWGQWVRLAVFLLLGLCSIVAALAYTMGKCPYGYQGFGDFMAGLFFGPLAVLGTAILCGLPITSFAISPALLPAIAAGLCSAAVLSVNNIRDINTDKAAGKKTVAVLLGHTNACIYHALLVGFTVILWFVFWLVVNPKVLPAVMLAIPLCYAAWQVMRYPHNAQHLITQLHHTNFSVAFLNIGMAILLIVSG